MDINFTNSKKVNLDSSILRSLYRDYKENILPLGVILICILMIFFVIIPEFKQYLVSRDQLKEEEKKLNVLKNNYNFLLNLDDSKSDTDFNIISQALPPNKDFVGMMSAITIAASKIGIAVGDFNFSLGDLDKVTLDSSKFPSVIININLVGNAQSIVKFIAELYKTVPASEVTKITTSGNFSSLVILFYYKPFPPQNLNEESPIVPLSSQNASLLKDVSLWNSSGDLFLPNVSASYSGTNPSPF